MYSSASSARCFLYALAMRCGARSWQALAAAGLLICNPCYLFLSFSFMSEIAFLAALLGSHLAFANAEGERQDSLSVALGDSGRDRIRGASVRRRGDPRLDRSDRDFRSRRERTEDSTRIDAGAICVRTPRMRAHLDLADGPAGRRRGSWSSGKRILRISSKCRCGNTCAWASSGRCSISASC